MSVIWARTFSALSGVPGSGLGAFGCAASGFRAEAVCRPHNRGGNGSRDLYEDVLWPPLRSDLNLQVGLVGYEQWQLTDKTGPGVTAVQSSAHYRSTPLDSVQA